MEMLSENAVMTSGIRYGMETMVIMGSIYDAKSFSISVCLPLMNRNEQHTSRKTLLFGKCAIRKGTVIIVILTFSHRNSETTVKTIA